MVKGKGRKKFTGTVEKTNVETGQVLEKRDVVNDKDTGTGIHPANEFRGASGLQISEVPIANQTPPEQIQSNIPPPIVDRGSLAGGSGFGNRGDLESTQLGRTVEGAVIGGVTGGAVGGPIGAAGGAVLGGIAGATSETERGAAAGGVLAGVGTGLLSKLGNLGKLGGATNKIDDLANIPQATQMSRSIQNTGRAFNLDPEKVLSMVNAKRLQIAVGNIAKGKHFPIKGVLIGVGVAAGVGLKFAETNTLMTWLASDNIIQTQAGNGRTMFFGAKSGDIEVNQAIAGIEEAIGEIETAAEWVELDTIYNPFLWGYGNRLQSNPTGQITGLNVMLEQLNSLSDVNREREANADADRERRDRESGPDVSISKKQ